MKAKLVKIALDLFNRLGAFLDIEDLIGKITQHLSELEPWTENTLKQTSDTS